MFSGSPVYSPGDKYAGETRPSTRDFVPSSWSPVDVLGGDGASMAIVAGVALALILWLGHGKK